MLLTGELPFLQAAILFVRTPVLICSRSVGCPSDSYEGLRVTGLGGKFGERPVTPVQRAGQGPSHLGSYSRALDGQSETPTACRLYFAPKPMLMLHPVADLHSYVDRLRRL